MKAAAMSSRAGTAWAWLLAVTMLVVALTTQARLGFNLQDEAFLWYGELRVLAGEVPLRDFRSYDPGRYWWAAAWSWVWGDGLIGLRAATWIFASLGLAAGLCVLRRVVRQPWELALGAILLAAWMYPPWKLYEPALALCGTLVAVRMLEAPSARRAAEMGVWVGITAVFARNFGAYGGLAALGVVVVCAWRAGSLRGSLQQTAALVAGVLVGYAPVLGAVLCVDGFATAFYDSILFYLRQDALNAALPVPWPWTVAFHELNAAQAASAAATGAGFVLLWSVPLVVLVCCARMRSAYTTVAIGCAVVAVFVSHHAAVRSDIFHLAQVFGPIVLCMAAAVIALQRVWLSVCMWLVMTGLTVFAVGVRQPAWRHGDSETLTSIAVRDETLLLPEAEARSLLTLQTLLERHVPSNAAVWIGPRFLGLYCVLDRRAPTWEIYPAFRGSPADQERMLAELAHVDWILHDARPIGRDESMVLERSHPLVWQELQRSFEPVGVQGLPATLLFLRRKH